MSRKKNPKLINKKYKQKLRILKKLRFVEKGAKEIDGRKKLTAKDKRRISRAWNEHSEITQSKNEFVSRKVDKKKVKLFKELGYKTYKDKVYINKEGADRITIAHTKINGKRELVIHKRGNQKHITDLVSPRGDIFELAENLGKLDLEAGEFITAQIEGRSKFRKRFKSIAALLNYISQFQPQQPLVKNKRRGKREQEKLRQELIDKMSIVRFKK